MKEKSGNLSKSSKIVLEVKIKSVSMHTDTQKSKKLRMRGQHYRAVELRYEGKTYEEIALLLTQQFEIDFKINTLRHWFSSGGFLGKEYLDYARKENNRRRQLIIEEVKKLIPLIPKKYDSIINRNTAGMNEDQLTRYQSVLRQTLRDLCELLNFRVEPDEMVTDPLDEYFDRAEAELDREEAVKNRSP